MFVELRKEERCPISVHREGACRDGQPQTTRTAYCLNRPRLERDLALLHGIAGLTAAEETSC